MYSGENRRWVPLVNRLIRENFRTSYANKTQTAAGHSVIQHCRKISHSRTKGNRLVIQILRHFRENQRA